MLTYGPSFVATLSHWQRLFQILLEVRTKYAINEHAFLETKETTLGNVKLESFEIEPNSGDKGP